MTATPGDRIRLTDMPNDPDPIPLGSLGTVISSEFHNWGKERQFFQINVDWDNGRTLALCVPPDKYEIIREG